MEISSKEFLRLIEEMDLSRVVAIDICIASKLLNSLIKGRMQFIKSGIMFVHTGFNYQYTARVVLTSKQQVDLFLVKEGKAGREYIFKHFSIYTDLPCTNIIGAVIDKVELGGGTLRKELSNMRPGKCLIGESIVVKETTESEGEFDEYDIYGYAFPGSPYSKAQSFIREKKFYFKEYGGKTVVSK